MNTLLTGFVQPQPPLARLPVLTAGVREEFESLVTLLLHLVVGGRGVPPNRGGGLKQRKWPKSMVPPHFFREGIVIFNRFGHYRGGYPPSPPYGVQLLAVYALYQLVRI